MRVLMATMKLDIGGAETHIVELSKALARRGVQVFVASNGGAYVEELENAGIKHFKVGLHSKSPSVLMRAYNSLKRIILENKIDVVHAHARIPGFLCGLLQARYRFRFVTTAHWVFDTRFPFNLLTDWGDRSLAVSDDIKKYLMENYNCPEESIGVTINGVDTEKFSDCVDYSDVARELGFGENRVRIVYVSRMDTDRSLAAHKLIEAVPELYREIPRLEVVIVGGGNDYAQVKGEAEEVNSRLGSRVIITTGARTDINKFVASGDVFVGVSRAALEAMACKKPAVIAGNEGYIGIFDESRLQISIDTNFCCRGCGETTTDVLRSDLLELLREDKADLRKTLGEYSLETVKKYYSVEAMADDALKMYISIIKDSRIGEVDISEFDDIERYIPHGNSRRDIDVMISGYYGFHNSGDDSILAAIIGNLRKKCPNIGITVLSKSPAETAKIYGVNSVNRLDLFRIFGMLRRTKLLISGGGSLIQDVTSSKSLYYYLLIIRLAKLCGTKVMLYANGIGPIVKKKNEKITKRTLDNIGLATLRDEASAQELKRLGVEVDSEVTADPVFSMEAESGEAVCAETKKAGIGADDRFFIIAVRDWVKNDPELEDKISHFAEYVYKAHKLVPLILPMQGIYDHSISEKIMNKVQAPCGMLRERYSPEMLLGIVGNAEFALGMRLHTLIYAAKMGTPVIALNYDPKVSAMMSSVGQSFDMAVDNIDTDMLCGYADEILKNREAISGALLKKSEEYKRLADRNAELAIGALTS